MKAKNKVLLARYESSRLPYEPPTTNAHTA